MNKTYVLSANFRFAARFIEIAVEANSLEEAHEVADEIATEIQPELEDAEVAPTPTVELETVEVRADE